MWGKAKIGPLARELGFAVSDATVGRILSDLIKRRRVPAVPDLLRKIGPRSAMKKRPYAVRKPKDVAFEEPGDIVQIDTLSISIMPGRTIKQFTAYDPFAKWTVAKPYKRATAKNAAEFLARVRAQMPDPVRAVQIDGGSEFMAEFWPIFSSRPAPTPKSHSTSSRPDRPSSTAPSSDATAPGDTSSTPAPTCRSTSTRSPNASTPSNTFTTTTDPTEPLPE